MDKISPTIIKSCQNIMNCISFNDNDVRLAVIRTLQELAKNERFKDVIDNNMSDILGLVSDVDRSVRAAAIDFVSDLAGKNSLQVGLNRNFPSFIIDNFKSQGEAVRRDRLLALGKMITSEQSYDSGIQKAFVKMQDWLSDHDKDVRRTALRVVTLAAGKAAFSDKIKNIVPRILSMLQDDDIQVRSVALKTLSEVVTFQKAPLKKTIRDNLAAAIPIITSFFTGDNEIRVTALETCLVISRIETAMVQDAVKSEILSALNGSYSRQGRAAALKTISRLAETSLCEIWNDDALDKIFGCLLDSDNNVRAQVLDTLTVLVSKEQFRNKMETAAQKMLPLLEDFWSTVRRKTLDTLIKFADYGIFVASDGEIMSPLISTSSAGDTETSARALKILSFAAKPGVIGMTHSELSVVTNSLSHGNWRVRLAGLRVLQSLADDTEYRKTRFPIQLTIEKFLSDEVEEVRLAGLRTLFEFTDKEVFGNRVTVPDTVPTVISSLLQSEDEDIRMSAIAMISTYVTKAEPHSAINRVTPAILEFLDRADEDSRVAMLQTVCILADTEKLHPNDDFVKDVIRRLPSLLSDQQVAVRMATLQIHGLMRLTPADALGDIVIDSLNALLDATTSREEDGGVDDRFHLEVLKTLSGLAKNKGFRRQMDVALSANYAQAAKDGSWPIRVAFLQLMAVLGASARDVLKTTVKQMIPDITETLHDNDSKVRMAGVQLLSIVKDLVSDHSKSVRIAALPLIPQVVGLGGFRDGAGAIMSAILKRLSGGVDECIVALEATRALISQDAAYAKELIPELQELIKFLRPGSDASSLPTIVLLILATVVTQDRESAKKVADVIPSIFSVFKDTDTQFWDAATKVLLALAGLGREPNDEIHGIILSCVKSALEHSNWRARVLGLSILRSIDRGLLAEFRTRDLVLAEATDLVEVCLPAIRVTGSLELDCEDVIEMNDAARKIWSEVLSGMKSTNGNMIVDALKKLSKIADYVDVFDDEDLTDVIPLLNTALKTQSPGIAVPCLRAISRLAAECSEASLCQLSSTLTRI
ncbi:hypothetical protein MSAN_01300400 [Mycena sanguinolenta]|uniref:Stalled ribosome sensor GCN1-like HEAT repeats region domain-containing protein n=1 Tax=Mycena sanguinolenta TaxID=230812 RepID=A0A8H6YFI4_9AGAR|nr:hypothetical protein MSAN_01300400 [Mycena sanguinolenta]